MIIKILLLGSVALLTYLVYMRQGAVRTFNKVLLPISFIIPFAFNYRPLLSLPEFTFYGVVALTLFILVLFYEKKQFRWNLLDTLIVAAVLFYLISATLTTTWKYGMVVVVDYFINTLIPYFLIRQCFRKEDIQRTLLILVGIVTAVATISPLEFFFNFKFAVILQVIWPDYALWPDFVRGGMFRVFSAYWHPIHAGVIFSVVIFITFYFWRTQFLRSSVALGIMGINFMAVYMTISRTSYILLAPLMLFLIFPYVKKKALYVIVLAVLGVGAYLIAVPGWDSYTASGMTPDADEAASSVAYRAVLYDNYINLVMEKPLFGYGFFLPVVDNQWSLDNHYLLLMLSTGLPGLIFLVTIMSVAALFGFFRFFTTRLEKEKYLIWTFLGILVYYAVVLGTVWMQAQIQLVLYMSLGFISILADKPKAQIIKPPTFLRIL